MPSPVALVIALVAGAVALPSSMVAQTPRPEVSGYVFGVSGAWGIAPQFVPQIVRGQAVHPQDEIRLKPEARPIGFINIGLLDGSILVRDCAKEKDCRSVRISVPRVNQAPSLSARAKALFEHLFDHGQPPLIFEMSRDGDDTAGPKEAVLRSEAQGVDFAAALKNVAAGDYELRTLPISGETKTGRKIPCNWKPPSARCTGDSELAEGLYRLEVRSQTHILGSPVPVLVVRAGRYNELAQAFGDAERIAAGWTSQAARTEAVHYFLSAALFDLAQQ